MGWYNSHLYAFRHSNEEEYIGIPYPELDDNIPRDATTIKIKSELYQVKQTMIYEYDFGDCWEHTVLLEILPKERSCYLLLLTEKAPARLKIAAVFTGIMNC